jgi:NUMOD3 motif
LGTKGWHPSEKTKALMSKAKRGEKNYFFGKHHSLETRRKLSLARSNEKAWNWKGDNVGYAALHYWVRKNLPEPKLCEFKGCEKPPHHLANITGTYNRDLKNWKYLCATHHFKIDRHCVGKRFVDHSSTRCIDCGSDKTKIVTKNNFCTETSLTYSLWLVADKKLGLYRCWKCYKNRLYSLKNPIAKRARKSYSL